MISCIDSYSSIVCTQNYVLGNISYVFVFYNEVFTSRDDDFALCHCRLHQLCNCAVDREVSCIECNIYSTTIYSLPIKQRGCKPSENKTIKQFTQCLDSSCLVNTLEKVEYINMLKIQIYLSSTKETFIQSIQ